MNYAHAKRFPLATVSAETAARSPDTGNRNRAFDADAGTVSLYAGDYEATSFRKVF